MYSFSLNVSYLLQTGQFNQPGSIKPQGESDNIQTTVINVVNADSQSIKNKLQNISYNW